MTNDNLNKLLVFCVLFCAQKTSIVHGAQPLETKVALLLHAEPEIPKCFAEGMSDLTCFWEEDEERTGSADQYSFIYTYQNENSSECAVTALPAAGGKRLYFCRLSQTQLFVPLDIRVFRDDLLIHNRSLFIELVFLLDPPANLTLTSTGTQGQLKASWLPPSLKYMGDSMMYEVSYAMAGSHIGKVEKVQASSELILRGLQSGTKYKVRIRVKLDGISYSGYWSAWTDPVLMETMPSAVKKNTHRQGTGGGSPKADLTPAEDMALELNKGRPVLEGIPGGKETSIGSSQDATRFIQVSGSTVFLLEPPAQAPDDADPSSQAIRKLYGNHLRRQIELADIDIQYKKKKMENLALESEIKKRTIRKLDLEIKKLERELQEDDTAQNKN
ncbi:erythropoietin receptor-like isoform X2 [Salvelinus alpinus]|uniref:erythropoietin receptor-like isoform X2 n=1 Tax=Salvelinus alpinus TaxID=8036 RepID=UPI0039FC52DC